MNPFGLIKPLADLIRYVNKMLSRKPHIETEPIRSSGTPFDLATVDVINNDDTYGIIVEKICVEPDSVIRLLLQSGQSVTAAFGVSVPDAFKVCVSPGLLVAPKCRASVELSVLNEARSLAIQYISVVILCKRPRLLRKRKPKIVKIKAPLTRIPTSSQTRT